MHGNPLVSIIIPAYNSAEYLADTLNSALNQTWNNKEIIVVNDGSTDDTKKIIESFKHNVTAINVTPNKGAASARNAALRVAKGQYIQFLDADDLLSPDKVESQLKTLNGSANQLAICKTVHFTNGTDYLLAHPTNSWYDQDMNDPVDFLVKLYAGPEVLKGYGGMVALHSWLTPADLIAKAGLWNEDLSVDDDGEFFCRVILASDGIRYSEQALCYYRKFSNGRSLSGQQDFKALNSAVSAIRFKFTHLKSAFPDQIVDRIFARHYWWLGVMAYPQYKGLSSYCIKQAQLLGYTDEKYVGGKFGHTLAALFGWKLTRRMLFYKQQLLKGQ